MAGAGEPLPFDGELPVLIGGAPAEWAEVEPFPELRVVGDVPAEPELPGEVDSVDPGKVEVESAARPPPLAAEPARLAAPW